MGSLRNRRSKWDSYCAPKKTRRLAFCLAGQFRCCVRWGKGHYRSAQPHANHLNLMSGTVSPYVATYPGNPNSAPTNSLNVRNGGRVIDTLTGAEYRKISSTLYVPSGINKAFGEDFNATDTADQVSVILPSGLVASGATGIMHHIYSCGGNIYGWCPLGAGQTLLPTIVATGLDIGGDQTSTEGAEIFSHFLGATGRPFVVGSDPAFFFQAKLTIADVSGITSLVVGFRRAAVNASAFATYTDYAGLGINASASPAAIFALSGNDGTDVATDTTQTIADGVALTIRVNVSATGAVTFLHDAAVPGVLAAPTAGGSLALDIDDGDPMIPMIFFIQGADLADAVIIQSWAAGYQ